MEGFDSAQTNYSKDSRKILVDSYSIVFFFNETRFGYDLEAYSPTMTDTKFRMRDLIFFFNKLHYHVDGFSTLKDRETKAYLRKKSIGSFIYFQLFFLPTILAMQLLIRGSLLQTATIISISVFLASIMMTVMFFIIDINSSKMEKMVLTSELAKDIKVYICKLTKIP